MFILAQIRWEIASNKRYACEETIHLKRNTSQVRNNDPSKDDELTKNFRTVEFAAEFGPSAALRPQSYDMNAIEYHNIVSSVLPISLV